MTELLPEADASAAPYLERRRQRVAERWALHDEVVLIGAGEQIIVPGRGDQAYPFRAHSEYLYLTDRDRPGGVLAFDPADGWVDFVAPVTADELLWGGAGSNTDDGVPLPQLSEWLGARTGRPIGCLGVPVSGVTPDTVVEDDLRDALNQTRRPKDALELARMRRAEAITREGFERLAREITAGRSEREVQIELEAEFFRRGADWLAFDTIVGSGPNSAVLHFAPTQRKLANGELVLVDAGAEYRGYASDVTRTYPVSGQFTPEQASLHEVVRTAGIAATARCTAGTEWRAVHEAAALIVAEGLAEFGLLRGDPHTLVESRAYALFFPHGIGHMVGLGIRDAGGKLRSRRESGDTAPLRVDLPLGPGFVMTVEPGIYFVPAILNDRDSRELHRDSVDWDLVDGMLGFGGIRVEENVLVTETGPDVLTADLPLLW